jgi:hypothetical protein
MAVRNLTCSVTDGRFTASDISYVVIIVCTCNNMNNRCRVTASVILWLEFMSRDREVPNTIPGAARFFDKYLSKWVPLSLMMIKGSNLKKI